jgi:GT2 family glycosyltransferase
VRIVAIIVNWNGGEYLPRALRALEAQRRRPDRIIVVDNASTDGSRQAIAAFADVELIEMSRNVGFAGANNVAAAAALDCDWIVFLNPDAFPDPEWLQRLTEAAAVHPEFAMFASELRLAADPEWLDGAGDTYHVSGLPWRIAHGQRREVGGGATREVFSPCAAAALIRRDAFDDVGGFDASYFCYVEDVDLAFRMRLRGQRCLYVPGAIAHHVGSGLAGRHSTFSVYHGHRNLVWTWFKNMPGWWLAWYLPQHLLLTLASLVRFGTTGHLSTIVRAKRDALLGLRPILAERRRVQRRRLVPSRSVIAAMTHGWMAPYRQHWTRPHQD